MDAMQTTDVIAAATKAPEVVVTMLKRLGNHGPFMVATLAVCLAGTFVPDRFVPPLLLGWRWAFAAVGIFVAVYLIAMVAFTSRIRRAERHLLKHLGVDEVQVLARYLEQNRSVLPLRALTGAAFSLWAKKLIMPPNIFREGVASPFMIHPWVAEYLRRHPNLVGLKPEQLGKTKLDEPDESAGRSLSGY